MREVLAGRPIFGLFLLCSSLTVQANVDGPAVLQGQPVLKCDPAAHDMTAEETVNPEVLLAQARTSFEARFSQVTSDARGEGLLNLKNMEGLLRRNREDFDLYLGLAVALLPSVEKELAVEHETSPQALKAILKGGAILSLYELVRLGIKPPLAKNSSTRADADGMIGEQDAVFLAIRRPLTSGYAQTWGDVTVRLKSDRVLESSYFSTFQFTDGLPIGALFGSKVGYSCAIPRYRQWIFSGRAQLQSLIILSAAELLWERERLPSTPADLEERLTVLGQTNPIDVPLDGGLREQVAHHWPRGVDPGNIKDILRAYEGFPTGPGDFPPMLAPNPDFWEIKVPRRVSTEWIESIAIPQECIVRPIPGWCGDVENTIRSYAASRHLSFTTQIKPHPIHGKVVEFAFGGQ